MTSHIDLTSSNSITAGIALPEDILSQPWFALFGLFVAFNTIIYLGLTVSKFIPWPQPVHPHTIRRAIPDPLKERSAMRVSPAVLPDRDRDTVSNLRRSTARETIPLALGLTGVISLVSSFINTLLYFDSNGPIGLVGAFFGFLFIILSQIMSRLAISDHVMIWTWTILMLLLVAEISWRAEVLDSAVVLGYALIALIVIAPITLSWSAGITAATVGLIPIIASGYSVSLVDTISWIIAAITGALASLVLLQLRMTSISRIAFEQQRAITLATTDPLTGVFSRTGLLALAPTVAEAAEKAQNHVCVIACDVEGMTAITRDYGIAYGDDVLAAAARCLRATLPEGSLIGRWDGDQFIALHMGGVPTAETLARQVDDALSATGIALGKRPATVHIRVASGSPRDTTFEDLVGMASTR